MKDCTLAATGSPVAGFVTAVIVLLVVGAVVVLVGRRRRRDGLGIAGAVGLVLVGALLLSGTTGAPASASEDCIPAPKPSATAVASPSVTTEPTVEPTQTPTATTEPTAEPTQTPTATATPTAEPTPTPTCVPEPVIDVTGLSLVPSQGEVQWLLVDTDDGATIAALEAAGATYTYATATAAQRLYSWTSAGEEVIDPRLATVEPYEASGTFSDSTQSGAELYFAVQEVIAPFEQGPPSIMDGLLTAHDAEFGGALRYHWLRDQGTRTTTFTVEWTDSCGETQVETTTATVEFDDPAPPA